MTRPISIKQRNFLKKELDWIRRQPKARGTKAKARVDKFYDIKEAASANLDSDELTIEIDMHRLGSKILELHNLGKSFGDKQIGRPALLSSLGPSARVPVNTYAYCNCMPEPTEMLFS